VSFINFPLAKLMHDTVSYDNLLREGS